MSDQPTQQPIQPQPCPVTINITRASTSTGDQLLRLVFQSVNGASVYFLTLDEAKHVAALIQDQAGGIVVPTVNGGPVLLG